MVELARQEDAERNGKGRVLGAQNNAGNGANFVSSCLVAREKWRARVWLAGNYDRENLCARGLPFSCHRVFMRAPRALKLELKISPLVVVSNVVADSFSSSSFSASSYGFAFNRPCCACWNFKRFVDPIFG